MNLDCFLQSRALARTIKILGFVLIALIIFQIGVAVGFHRGSFMYDWNMAITRGLDDPRSIIAPFLHAPPDSNAPGTAGQIISIDLPVILVKGVDNSEQAVYIGSSTAIRIFRESIASSGLKIGDQIITIGERDSSGMIHASLVRIIPNLLTK